ncbi:MAG TPA: hypothetical protein VGO60_06975 [Iamia sp.]|jgi:uncharacterized membrane-anchored protein|nr:hypothetical protein [Iamia sp.]
MTDPTASDGTAAARRRADLMVGLFVGAIVALLGGITVLVTSGSAGLGIGLIVVAVAVGVTAVLLLRSITPEERERLTAPAPTDDGADENR